MRRPSLILLGCAVLVTGLVTAVPPTGARTNGGSKFIVTCLPSHQSADDPIGHPGMPGDSHLHDFFGSTATGADSTVDELEAAPTTCDVGTDTAAYWTPTVYRGGVPVKALAITAYYRNLAHDPADIRPFPQGLKMLAGKPDATKPQSLHISEWSCRQPSGLKGSWFSVPPVCTTGRQLVMKVWFPDCWDGVNLDSPDHVSHVGYSHSRGICPANLPVNIPELAITVALDAPVADGPPDADGTAGYFDDTMTLSSGSVYTLHADFWNAWNQPGLADLVQYCLVENNPCPAQKIRHRHPGD